jgi:hypothetical protein
MKKTLFIILVIILSSCAVQKSVKTQKTDPSLDENYFKNELKESIADGFYKGDTNKVKIF